MAPSVDTPDPPPPPTLTRTPHTLPAPFTNSSLSVLTQGAEALVYRTTFLTPNTPCVLKYRPPKPYRHPTLDKRLTKARLLAEARVLVRVRKEGIKVPAVLGGDWENGWLVLEWVGGSTVRRVLDGWVESVQRRLADAEGGREQVEQPDLEAQVGGEEEILDLMRRIGRAVGKLHGIGVVHGDLTTSNLMLRPTPKANVAEKTGQLLDGDIVLIDFGLASQTTTQQQDEDRAVDLYVLERAFAATHPSAEPLFQEVLKEYGESYNGAKKVLKRLADVRLRGRKRSMLG
ncbi:serine/threonine-protein kinase bud32 [Lophiostoma macrostomum CBS 122681]|uniref:EKC/KEOPS complex subunit BUD32 n=1 Tax=Lophiostoma macrostomum CBS 122681 TaxID=1314788 RepID=A0A6A6SM45_9PLEO|nr:serine/threonine-protein kinase bud32 [Lophiostoma macrostomum CBS 122681]